jgi:hypothetical protein
LATLRSWPVSKPKRLLYDDGYTIAGARKALKDKTRGKKERAVTPKRAAQGALFADPSSETIDMIKKELQELLTLLG